MDRADFVPEASIVRTSADAGALIEALAAAQGEFPLIDKKHVGEVKNDAGRLLYTYRYADIADVLAAVRPVLSKHKLAVLQPTYIRNGALIVATRLMHASGQWMESEYPVSAIGAKHQAMGGALTYARRYSLCSLIGVSAEEDKDGEEAAQVERTRKPAAQVKPERQPAQPLSPKGAMIDAIRKTTSIAKLEHVETNEKFEADFAKLSHDERAEVRAAIAAHRETLFDPTAIPDAPPSARGPQAQEEVPPHEPGRMSQRARDAASNRKPAERGFGREGAKLIATGGNALDLDDEIPF